MGTWVLGPSAVEGFLMVPEGCTPPTAPSLVGRRPHHKWARCALRCPVVVTGNCENPPKTGIPGPEVGGLATQTGVGAHLWCGRRENSRATTGSHPLR